jgi:hypothetical protein
MKKLSEILEIGMNFYDPTGQSADKPEFMCNALEFARSSGLTKDDVEAGQAFCRNVVNNVCPPEYPGCITLYKALYHRMGSTPTPAEQWDVWLKEVAKLKNEGL